MSWSNNVDDIHARLRKLAKRNDYQTVYSFSKESPIWVFQNRENFSSIQITFLTYLSFYNSIQMDIYMGEIDERILTDPIYEDAYCYYRNQQRQNPGKTRASLPAEKDKSQERTTFQWLFKSKKKT